MDRYYELRLGQRESLAGKEVTEITPVILGGSPIDPTNKVVLDRNQHIQAVVYWNRMIREMRQSTLRNSGGE
jgi:hypothetical protein